MKPINKRSSTHHVDVSIIIPTFNRSDFLKLTIASVLRQKGVSMEIVVSDDCSTDNTASMVKAFGDKRIKYLKNKKRLGTSMNFQKCFYASSGDFIFTLGDDDCILDENTLAEVLKVMKKYKLGMSKIGTIVYEKEFSNPYQVAILSEKLIVLKPEKAKEILTDSIDFGIGFYSGLMFNNLLIDKEKIKMDHTCYADHMCQMYHPLSYDLILKHGIAYIPKHFIVAHLSLQLIPRYFNIERHGRLFMEDPIIQAKEFIKGEEFEHYKREFLRRQIVLLPNIKFFSDNQNLTRVLQRMVAVDKTLLHDVHFIFWAFMAYAPKFMIKAMRDAKIIISKKSVSEAVRKHQYLSKIKNLENYYHKKWTF